MPTKTTGRKASAKTAARPASAKVKAPRAASLKKTAAATLPIAPTAPKRRLAASKKAATLPAPVTPAGTKQSRLIALLRAQPGATIEQMTSLTGWQPHTVRGTISGVLRKRLGLNVACAAESGVSVYRILAASAA